MIGTILLQSKELKLQRNEISQNRIEFAKSAAAQERSSQLSALAALVIEIEKQIEKNTQFHTQNTPYGRPQHLKDAAAQIPRINQELLKKKEYFTIKIEDILKELGISFELEAEV